MKKKIFNLGILVLFYAVLVGGVLLLNMRFANLNKNTVDNYVVNK